MRTELWEPLVGTACLPRSQERFCWTASTAAPAGRRLLELRRAVARPLQQDRRALVTGHSPSSATLPPAPGTARLR